MQFGVGDCGRKAPRAGGAEVVGCAAGRCGRDYVGRSAAGAAVGGRAADAGAGAGDGAVSANSAKLPTCWPPMAWNWRIFASAGRSRWLLARSSRCANGCCVRERLTAAPGNRHAAVLAGGYGEGRFAVGRSSDEGIARSIWPDRGEYLKSKTGKAAIRRIDCRLTDRQLEQLAAATSAPVCEGGSEPWTGRQKFIVSFATAERHRARASSGGRCRAGRQSWRRDRSHGAA